MILICVAMLLSSRNDLLLECTIEGIMNLSQQAYHISQATFQQTQ